MKGMLIIAGLAGFMAFVALSFALWDRNMPLAVANFNTVIWTVLYIFKKE